MSNLVTQIIDGMETQIASTLGASYGKLDYVFSVEDNNFRGNALRYGVIPQGASDTEGVVRAVTLDHEFQVILTDNYINQPNTDSSQMIKLKTMYDKMDDLSNALYNSKVGLPSIVLLAIQTGYDEPEFIEEDNIVVLRATYSIKYRRNL